VGGFAPSQASLLEITRRSFQRLCKKPASQPKDTMPGMDHRKMPAMKKR
jgi:hypothetical protein